MWAPFLSSHKDAATIGMFQAWTEVQPNGKAKGAGDARVRQALKTVVTNMKSSKPVNKILSGIGDNEGLFFGVCNNIEMGYDNSPAFASYLKKQGLQDALSGTGLKMRKTHCIVPPRIGVPIDASKSALPEFENEESWYHATMMNSISWSERYVELAREEAKEEH
ncbi:hypothetical protein NMY22_g1970 [Coprinellus aureogranulatus]|nr:hypothetical protein NMY22_g1970 [Coprinellus aureogranulatus]